METLSLNLSPRTVTGKKVRMLRRAGVVPVHFYGEGTESLAMQAEAGVLRRLLPQVGMNIPISVKMEDQDGENICFVREVQRHPVTEALLHVDFLRVDISQTMTADVPIILEGTAPGVENLGGVLIQMMQALPIESLPMNIPRLFTLDVSGLETFENALRVSDVQVGPGVSIVAEPDEMIARVLPPRLEEEEEEEEEEVVELAEGEEAEPGDESPEEAEGEDEGRESHPRRR